MSDSAKDSVATGLGRGFLYGLLFFSLFFIFALSGGRSAFMIQIPIHFVCGWLFHSWNALPPFLAKWQEAVLPLGCLAIAGVLTHRFVVRWAGKKRPSLDWRRRHTAAVFSLLLLCSAAAIATSGVVHQFFWLASGKVIESNRRAHLTVALSNGRQLMLALLEFHNEKGRYPFTFEELDVPPQLYWIETSSGGASEPFVLLRPGATDIALDEDPLIVSPLLSDGRKLVVGYGDTSVRTMAAKSFSDMIKLRKATPDE